jgi:hypothetical protein
MRDGLCEVHAVLRRLLKRALCGALVVSALAWACSLPDKTPTEPEPVQSAAPAPSADPNPTATPTPSIGATPPKTDPTPEPTPSAVPTPQPTPTPDPGTGEGSAECGSPLPPPLARFNVKVHIKGAASTVLDSTPLVDDAAYCAKVGFPDRSVCPVRPEGNPQRAACELYIVGRAADTGRPGPTWYHGSSLCKGGASGCDNHSDNQYLLVVYTGGNYRACAQSGVCGDVDVDR